MTDAVVYVDAYLASIAYSGLMTSLALWVTGRIASRPLKLRKCLRISLYGGLLLAWVYLSRFGILPGRRLATHPIVWFATGTIMVWSAWRPIRLIPGMLLRFLLVSIIPVGLAAGVRSLMGLGGTEMPAWVFASLPPVLMLVLAEMGWGVVHEALFESALVPLEITFGPESIRVQALVDTGNLLTDPLTRVPVVVVEVSALSEVMPESVYRLVRDMCAGRPAAFVDEAEPWLRRVRLLPYLTVGCERGIMTGFRADQVRVGWAGRDIAHCRVVIGVSERALSQDGSYRALVPPSLILAA